MPVFLERFILPALAAVLIGVIMLNPLKFDRQQQVSLAIAVVALAYFVGVTVHRSNEAKASSSPIATIPSAAEPSNKGQTGNATAEGDGSIANTGAIGTINEGSKAANDKQK